MLDLFEVILQFQLKLKGYILIKKKMIKYHQ